MITWGKSIMWQTSGWLVTNGLRRGIVIVMVVGLRLLFCLLTGSKQFFATPSATENSIIPPLCPPQHFQSEALYSISSSYVSSQWYRLPAMQDPGQPCSESATPAWSRSQLPALPQQAMGKQRWIRKVRHGSPGPTETSCPLSSPIHRVQGKLFQSDLTPANWLFCMVAMPHSTHATRKGARRTSGSDSGDCKRGGKWREVGEKNSTKVLINTHAKRESWHSTLHALRLGELKLKGQCTSLTVTTWRPWMPIFSRSQCLWKTLSLFFFFNLFPCLIRPVTTGTPCHDLTTGCLKMYSSWATGFLFPFLLRSWTIYLWS